MRVKSIASLALMFSPLISMNFTFLDPIPTFAQRGGTDLSRAPRKWRIYDLRALPARPHQKASLHRDNPQSTDDQSIYHAEEIQL
jgi:hypothetical protein